MRLFLARHGQTEWNAVHRLQGRTDIALTALGRQQAQALASFLAAQPVQAVYASPLRRARDTAQPVAAVHGLEVHVREALLELGYGILEGRTAEDTDPEIRALWQARRRDPLGYDGPGAETYARLHARVEPFAHELRRKHARDTIVVVGHRASNRVLLACLLGWSLERALDIKQKNDCVLEVSPEDDPEIRFHRLSHLVEPGGDS